MKLTLGTMLAACLCAALQGCLASTVLLIQGVGNVVEGQRERIAAKAAEQPAPGWGEKGE